MVSGQIAKAACGNALISDLIKQQMSFYCKSLLLSYLLAYKWFLSLWRPKSYCIRNWTWSLLCDWDVPTHTHIAVNPRWWADCAHRIPGPYTHIYTHSLFFSYDSIRQRREWRKRGKGYLMMKSMIWWWYYYLQQYNFWSSSLPLPSYLSFQILSGL